MTSTQQDELASQDRIVGHQSIQVSAAGYRVPCGVSTIPMEPMVAGLLWPLVEDCYSLAGQ